jgi:hypothetical protein
MDWKMTSSHEPPYISATCGATTLHTNDSYTRTSFASASTSDRDPVVRLRFFRGASPRAASTSCNKPSSCGSQRSCRAVASTRPCQRAVSKLSVAHGRSGAIAVVAAAGRSKDGTRRMQIISSHACGCGWPAGSAGSEPPCVDNGRAASGWLGLAPVSHLQHDVKLANWKPPALAPGCAGVELRVDRAQH